MEVFFGHLLGSLSVSKPIARVFWGGKHSSPGFCFSSGDFFGHFGPYYLKPFGGDFLSVLGFWKANPSSLCRDTFHFFFESWVGGSIWLASLERGGCKSFVFFF